MLTGADVGDSLAADGLVQGDEAAVFADKAYYAINATDPKKPVIVPFLLKKDAQAHAAKIGGKLAEFREALTVASAPF